MDVLKELSQHPAFKHCSNVELARKRLQVIDEFDKLKSMIAEHRITVRVKCPNQKYIHYKGCWEFNVSDDHPGDRPASCLCDLIGMSRHRIIKLLDDIEAMGGGNPIKRLVSTLFLGSCNGDTSER